MRMGVAPARGRRARPLRIFSRSIWSMSMVPRLRYTATTIASATAASAAATVMMKIDKDLAGDRRRRLDEAREATNVRFTALSMISMPISI